MERKITEKKWVESQIPKLRTSLKSINKNLDVTDGRKLPYSSEILSYRGDNPVQPEFIEYETDILIWENSEDGSWKPRIIIETKINSVTTHDAITYSQKAEAHKRVHPYLRYGIMIGNREHHPLPGRLFRHGQHFDFMQSWEGFEAKQSEWDALIQILEQEYQASLLLEEIIFNTRSKDRDKFTLLHKPLRLE